MFCRSALLLSFCENRFSLSQLIKKLNSTERGALFDIFASPGWSPLRMRTKVVSFSIFSKSFQTKKLRLYDQRWLERLKNNSTVVRSRARVWKRRVNSVVCLKKKKRPFVAVLRKKLTRQWVAIALFPRISFFDGQVNRKTKGTFFDARWALTQKKVPASLTWWHFCEVLQLFVLWFSADSRMQKLDSDKFDQRRIRRRMWSVQ